MVPQLLVYTLPYSLAFWTVFICVFAPESAIAARGREPSATPQDAHSKSILVSGQFIAMVTGFAVAFLARSGSLAHPVRWFWLGVATMVAGSLVRYHCRRMLGSSFTGAVIVRDGHEVIERGAYRYVRHPSYTAAALIYLGIGLALGNWIAVLIIMAGVALAFGYRVRVEERALLSVIGEPYRDYMARTKRFVPFLW